MNSRLTHLSQPTRPMISEHKHIYISADPCCSRAARERINFCEAIRNDMLGLLGVQKATFGSLGCRPRARSVPHLAFNFCEAIRKDTLRSESDVWHSGLPAAGPIRPSLPWCFGAAAASLNLGWQCRTAGKGKVCS